MNNYKDSERFLNTLRCKDMWLFCMAISYVMDVGIRHLTPENIERTCAEIMQEDDHNHFMTKAYKCDLIRMAGEIAQVDHIHLLTYISRHVVYDVGDGGFCFEHSIEIISKLIDYIEYDVGSYQACYDVLRECDIEDEDLQFIGYDYMIPNDDEENEEE